MDHIVVFFANGFGDHFMSTPALRAIRTIPCRRLTLMWPAGLRDAFLVGLNGVEYREFEFYFRHGRKTFDINALSNGIANVDVFVCLQPWCSDEIQTLIQNVQPQQTIGFDQRFDIVVKRDNSDHYVDGIFRLASALRPRAELSHFSYRPKVPKSWHLQTERVLATLPIGARVLAWHADTKANKEWNPKKFASVLLEFLDDHEEYFAIGVGFNNAAVRREARHKRLIAIDGLALRTNLGLLTASDLFLGVDSCMLHVADILRIPGVGLFGPSRDAADGSDAFGFRFGPHTHISGQGSMDNIVEEEVLRALSILARPQTTGGQARV